MWEKLIGLFQLLWDAGKQAQDNRADIESLAEKHERLNEVVRILATQNVTLHNETEAVRAELRHERELRERDNRELELKLRLQISEDLRRLPPDSSTPS